MVESERDVKALVALLSDAGASAEARGEAALALASLTGGDAAASCAEVVAAGGLAPLVAGTRENDDLDAREQSARCLGHMARDTEATRNALVEAGAVEALASLLADEAAGIGGRAAAAEALDNLVRGNDATGNAARMDRIAAAGALPNLVSLLGEGDTGARERAACAIYALGFSDSPRRAELVKAGALPALKAAAAHGGSGKWWSNRSIEMIQADPAAHAA